MGLANRFPSRSGADSTPVRLRPSIPRSLRHLPNRLIVAWKPEYLWNAAETGFLAQIAMFNSAAGCRVISETRSSPNDLRQVLEFPGSDRLLLEKLQLYVGSGFVRYAQPDFLYIAETPKADSPVSQGPRHRHFKRSRAIK